MSLLRILAIKIRDVKSQDILFKLFLFLCLLVGSSMATQAMPVQATLQDDGSGTCKIKVLKSTGELQTGVYAKVFANFRKFDPDETGVITVSYTSSAYTHTATLYFYGESESYNKKVRLDLEKGEMTVCFDRPKDIQEYKRTARQFPIEGMVVDDEGNPIERATVSIQGTGRRTLTDEMGLFEIDADFNHDIVIRADGMENLSLPVSHFLEGEEGFNVTLKPKNGWDIYSSAEIMPEFPGGMKAFQQYLQKNLEYPEKAKKAKKEGVVVVQFVVETNGEISDPRIARHLELSMDSAAWRLVKNMPRWTPASDYGTRVRCKYSLPVAFRIPKPKPVVERPIGLDSLKMDSLAMDSLALDSMRMQKALLADSLKADSLRADSLQQDIRPTDSLSSNTISRDFLPTDSLQQDSTRIASDTSHATVKAKKRNVFVRFFRWLFGIERRQRKRAEKAQLQDAQADSIKTVLTSPKEVPAATLELSDDSIKVNTDSINVDAKKLKKEAEKLTKKNKKNKKSKKNQ